MESFQEEDCHDKVNAIFHCIAFIYILSRNRNLFENIYYVYIYI